MSFSTEIKNEISRIKSSKSEYIAELSGYARNNLKIKENEIELNTENVNVAKRIISLFKELYDVNVNIKVTKNLKFKKNNLYILSINKKIDFILEDLNILDKQKNRLLKPHPYLTDNIDDKKAYIRGVFLSSGSINDPKTSRYHMELLLDYPDEAVFVQRLVNEFDLNSKILNRDKGYMVYLKEAEKISDFIKIIQANKAVMYYEDIRVLRDKKNKTNRLNNCEQANIDKVISSALSQIKDIEKIQDKIGLEFIDEKLQEAASYRLKYPETSLLELSKIISIETDKKITKSGLNHRFRKIREIAEKLQ